MGVVVSGAVLVAAAAVGAFALNDSGGKSGSTDVAAAPSTEAPLVESATTQQPDAVPTGVPSSASPSATHSSASPVPSKTSPSARAHTPAPSSTRPSKAPRPSASTKAPGTGPVGPDPKVPGPRSSSQSVSDAEAMSLKLLNAERATVGLPPLQLKADLSDFARGWAKHMRTSGFGHSSSGDTGYLVTGSRTWIGENIVWWSDESMTAQQAAEKFQSMWRHSPGHYKAQTSREFTEVGVGLYHDDSGWWGVHNFSDGR
ncbi:CAP domain-containing protein [Streptomyces sp. NPDC059176]|uniref:CAP domain-containing protein n=1 Tax=unclassified Streptomyces TaxID=2593676 RepID=UPI00367DBC85